MDILDWFLTSKKVLGVLGGAQIIYAGFQNAPFWDNLKSVENAKCIYFGYNYGIGGPCVVFGTIYTMQFGFNMSEQRLLCRCWQNDNQEWLGTW